LSELTEKLSELTEETDGKNVSKRKALDGTPLDPKDMKIPGLEKRPWYMKVILN